MLKTDLDTIRALLEKLGIPYTTIKGDYGIRITIAESPSIAFTFSNDGEAYSIYNLW